MNTLLPLHSMPYNTLKLMVRSNGRPGIGWRAAESSWYRVGPIYFDISGYLTTFRHDEDVRTLVEFTETLRVTMREQKSWSHIVGLCLMLVALAVGCGESDGNGTCTPNCEGATCGADGCGDVCGTCGLGEGCVDRQCVVCTPSCDSKSCGDDGCGGMCGTCGDAQTCENGICINTGTCTPDCSGKQCGDDECGGSCPNLCTGNQECQNNVCVTPTCTPSCNGTTCGDDGCGGTCACNPGTVCDPITQTCGEETVPCGDVTYEGCCDGQVVKFCYEGSLQTIDCVGGDTPKPSCGWSTDEYYDCGTDGMADPSGANPMPCGACLPDCGGKNCGADGCGGTCGVCAAGTTCEDNQCVGCTPDCAGKTCGDDGCGATCGLCAPDEVCDDAVGQCAEGCGDITYEGCCMGTQLKFCDANGQLKEVDCSDQPECGWNAGGGFYGCSSDGAADPSGQNPKSCGPCEPSCDGKICGDNGCGGTCGVCAADQMCDATGQCVCAPSCTNEDDTPKMCGDDGCGGNCGTCTTGEQCVKGACAPGPPAIAAGASCWQMDGECAEGTSCYVNATFTDFVCYPDNIEGSSCAYGEGLCVDGASCIFTDKTLSTPMCYADNAVGQQCSFGKGMCVDDANCFYTDITLAMQICYADQPLGASCAFGLGLCQEGSQCYTTDSGTPKYQCFADQADGAPCGQGLGGCQGDSECLQTLDPADGTICHARVGDGQVCGLGVALCEYGLGCTFTAETDVTGICTPLKLAGETCGLGIGRCVGITTCFDGICYKNGKMGDKCGPPAFGACWTNLECDTGVFGDDGTCVDPCEEDNKYGDGTCDECIFTDPDCF